MDKKAAKFLGDCVRKIQCGEILSREEAKYSFKLILDNDTNLSNFYWGSLFSSIKSRRKNDLNETLGLIDAILEFDSALQSYLDHKIEINSRKPVVSITGSGKETFKTFNVSTATAIVAASCGLTVVKPGSKSTSAYTGATDVLNELGITISNSLDEAKYLAENVGLCFIDYSNIASKYATRYDNMFYHFHPLSYIVPPLYIPFKVDSLLYGIADPDIEHSANLLKHFGYYNSGVVFGDFGGHGVVDEAIPFGNTHIAKITKETIELEKYSQIIKEYSLKEISHENNHVTNAEKLLGAISGEGHPSTIEFVAYNTGFLLKLSGIVNDLDEGIKVAKQAIYSKKPLMKLKEFNDLSKNLSKDKKNIENRLEMLGI